MGLTSGERTSRRLNAELRERASDSTPKSEESRSASNLSGLAGPVSLEGFGGERVELPTADVRLQLAIPDLGVEVVEPPSERCKFLGGQRLDLLLEGLNLAHAARVAPFGRVG